MSCQHRPPIEALLFPHAGRTEGEGGKTGSRRVMAGGFSAWWKRSVTRLPNKHQMEPFVKITILGLQTKVSNTPGGECSGRTLGEGSAPVAPCLGCPPTRLAPALVSHTQVPMEQAAHRWP